MPDIQKISIALTGEQISSLKSAVETGEYATTSEVIREALREWKWKRDLRMDDLNRLRELWTRGNASGPSTPVDFAQTRTEARHRLKKASAEAA